LLTHATRDQDREVKSAQLGLAHEAKQRALAQKREEISRQLWVQSRAMEAELDNKVHELEGQLYKQQKEQEQEQEKQREKVDGLELELRRREGKMAAKDELVAALTADKEQLEKALLDSKNVADQQMRATALVDDHLDKAYADLNDTETARKTAVKAKDAAELREKEALLTITDLNQRLAKAQDTIEDLEAQTAGLADLERDNANLQDEMDAMRDSFSQRDDEFTAKDERILRLEIDLDRALEGKLTAEAAASAAEAASFAANRRTAPPKPRMDSLQDELAELADSDSLFVDNVPTVAQLGLSTVTEITTTVSSTQTDAPTLAISSIHATSVAPIAPQITITTVASTQADAPEKSEIAVQTDGQISNEMATQTTQTDVPNKSAIAVQTDGPIKNEMSTQTTQTDVPNKSAIAVQTDGPINNEMATQTEATTPAFSSSSVQPTIDIGLIAIKTTPNEFSTISTIDIAPVEAETVPIELSIPTISDITVVHESSPDSPVLVPSTPAGPRPQTLTMSAITVVHESSPQDLVFVPSTPVGRLFNMTKKLSLLNVFNILALIFTLFALWLWQQQQVLLAANGLGYYAPHYHSPYGAFGQGRYLFGFIPVGFSIGQSWWSEKWCRIISRMIMNFEKYFDIVPVHYY
jgi:hypothetical protein